MPLPRAGGRWRYVQARLDGLARTHHLAEIADSGHLTRALAAAEAGARPADIAAAVAAGGVEPGRAERYVGELIEAQVLLAELAVTITGPPPVDALIADLEAAGDGRTAAVLRAVGDELAAIDAEGAKAGPERHAGIAALLGELPIPAKRSRLLQVDATVPECGATLARSVVDDVVRGVELLRRIAPAPEPTELERFREAFIERYEGREVALLEAVDDDLGAGFGAGGRDPAPLLKGLLLPRSERQATIGRRERRLLELMHRAWALGALEVPLHPGDIAELERDDVLPLPGAAGAMASLARTPRGRAGAGVVRERSAWRPPARPFLPRRPGAGRARSCPPARRGGARARCDPRRDRAPALRASVKRSRAPGPASGNSSGWGAPARRRSGACRSRTCWSRIATAVWCCAPVAWAGRCCRG